MFSSRQLHPHLLPELDVEAEFELDNNVALINALLPDVLLGEDWLDVDRV